MKSTAVVGGITLLSRIMGFVRDMIIAHVFGASTSTDAFLIAFKIPNFMRRLFAEGAFSQAFTPILSEYKVQRSHGEVQHLVNHVAGNLGGILTIITILGIIAAPLLVLIFAPGFSANTEKFDLTIDMLQITFPYLLFIALTAFAGSILNTYGQFSIPAITPVLLNISMIITTLYFAPYFERPVMALAWGVFIAGIIQLCFQLPFLYRLRLLPRPKFNWRDEGVQRIHTLMLPALLGVSVAQINLLVDTLMASFLVTGSVSWLYYSDRLMEFPLGVFGIALATVMLPNLSKTFAKGEQDTYNRTLDWALRWVFLIATPAMLGLIILSVPILSTLFFRGEFTGTDIIKTSHSLMAYAVGLLGFVLVKVLASAYYARQDTRTPVRIAVIAMLTNLILNIALISSLHHAGLALATALAAILNAALLFRGLYKNKVFIPCQGWRILLLRILFANGIMGGLLWWGMGSANSWLALNSVDRILQLCLWIGLGFICYIITLAISGLRPAHLSLKS